MITDPWNQFLLRHWLPTRDGRTVMLPTFICTKCKEDNHKECEGIKKHQTFCDCQHGDTKAEHTR